MRTYKLSPNRLEFSIKFGKLLPKDVHYILMNKRRSVACQLAIWRFQCFDAALQSDPETF
jgi:hypothetical protein